VFLKIGSVGTASIVAIIRKNRKAGWKYSGWLAVFNWPTKIHL
jgi:hypothetical protein